MVHFPASSPSSPMCSAGGRCHPGSPHSETRGSSVVGTSPRLFAAVRVLPRLAAPRHPPWTLIRLTILSFQPFAIDLKRTVPEAPLEAQGLEPWTLGLQSRCSSQLSHAPSPAPDADGKRENLCLEAFHREALPLPGRLRVFRPRRL